MLAMVAQKLGLPQECSDLSVSWKVEGNFASYSKPINFLELNTLYYVCKMKICSPGGLLQHDW